MRSDRDADAIRPPLVVAEHVDRICDAFEAAWRGGARPRIEDYWSAADVVLRPSLLRELVAAEIELRRADGERPEPAEYLDRFPGSDALLSPLFDATEPVEEPADGPVPIPAAPCIPGYLVIEELGRGGMGVVYLARQQRLGRTVALKMIPAADHGSAEAVARSLAEARLIARLKHPHIVEIYQVGDHDGRPYLELEYLEGGSLADRLRGQPWPPRDASELIRAIATGIGAAHRLGVIHRDLKPANILLTADGTPKIADFGLAKGIGQETGLTRTDAIIGTPAYMAPEQAMGRGRDAGPAADIHALGAILYELLTGRAPFRAATMMETLDRVRSAEAVPPRRLEPKLPRDLETICLRCLEKEPARRFVTAEELADELVRFLDGLPIRSRPVARVTRLARWCRRNRAVALAGGLSALAIAIAMVVSLAFGIESSRAAARLRAALDESRRLSAGLAQDRGQALCEQGDIARGVLWLGRGLELADQIDAPDLRRGIRATLGAWCRKIHPLRAILVHVADLSSIAISPDGTLAATGCDDGSVRLWDVATGGSVGGPTSQDGPIRLVAFRRDGGAILTVGGDGPALVRSRDAWTRSLPPLSLDHPGGARAAAFRPDGGSVLTAGQDGTARLWDAETGREAGPAMRHGAPVLAVAFRPDGRAAATCGEDGRVRLWDVETGRCLWTADGHRGGVRTVAFSPDGRSIATGCEGGAVLLRDAVSGRARGGALRHAAAVQVVAFSPDGTRLLTAGRDWTARLWKAETGEPAGPPMRHLAPVEASAFGPDGRLILTGSRDGTARLWEADTSLPVGPPLVHAGPVVAVAFGPDGRIALTADHTRAARLWEVRGDRPADRPLSFEGWPTSVAISDDARSIAVAAEGQPVRVFDADSGRPVGVPLPHPGGPDVDGGAQVVAFFHDGRAVASAGEDRLIRLRSVADGREIRPALLESSKLHAMAVRPDDRALLAGRRDGAVSLWDLRQGGHRESRPAHQGPVLSIAWAPDGRTFLTGGADLAARFWDAATLRPLGSPLPHRGQVWAVTLSGDGRIAATGGDDGTVHFWDADTGRPRGLTLANRWPIRSMALATDARTVLVGSRQESSRLWDVATARPIGPPLPHDDAVLATAFDRGAPRALTVAEDRTVRSLPLAGASEGDREPIGVWIKVATGMDLDPEGGATLLEPWTWEKYCRRLQADR